MSERRRSVLKETTPGRKAGYHLSVSRREAARESMTKIRMERLYQVQAGMIGSRIRYVSIPKKMAEKRKTVKWKIMESALSW
jgi:hypothetical protein